MGFSILFECSFSAIDLGRNHMKSFCSLKIFAAKRKSSNNICLTSLRLFFPRIVVKHKLSFFPIRWFGFISVGRFNRLERNACCCFDSEDNENWKYRLCSGSNIFIVCTGSVPSFVLIETCVGKTDSKADSISLGLFGSFQIKLDQSQQCCICSQWRLVIF